MWSMSVVDVSCDGHVFASYGGGCRLEESSVCFFWFKILQVARSSSRGGNMFGVFIFPSTFRINELDPQRSSSKSFVKQRPVPIPRHQRIPKTAVVLWSQLVGRTILPKGEGGARMVLDLGFSCSFSCSSCVSCSPLVFLAVKGISQYPWLRPPYFFRKNRDS